MASAEPAEWKGPPSNKTFMGHPVGLFVLFFTEMWERFSYYGMRGLLKLYMVNYLFITARQTLQGKAYDGVGNPDDVIGWSFFKWLLPAVEPSEIQACVANKAKSILADNAGMALETAQNIATQTCSVEPNASLLYGIYTGLVYLTPVFGGLMADKYLGQKKSVYLGAIVMALGQFVLFGADNLFFIGLALLIIGNGFFKPNISTQVGNLYPPGDRRRDGAFTIFYMGINLGAFICNFVCGTLAAVYGWRYGFLAAGIGMCIGLVVQFVGRNTLAPDTLQERKGGAKVEAPKQPLTSDEWKRVWALAGLCGLNIVFWAVYEQQGNTMQTWADENTFWPDWASSTWFQSANPLFIFMFAPLLDIFWSMQNKKGKEPSSVAKMAIGCLILGMSFIVMVIGARVVGDSKGSLFWPVFCTLLLTIGELYLSPIGLSLVTKVAPVRIVSLMMGIWYLSSFFGNLLSGFIGRFYTTMSKDAFFLMLMVLGVAAGVAIALFNKPLKKAMGAQSS
ncbi:peptide MFS transporter [Hyalangium rubrum]|uniref:Peptide MFS transporter n=1 Tax=Hyalangium rubrum TaxID=3103134 RepID=A0ABU5GWT6_9BACT|nr:peptide MFS transporter [Hyalangium sp. s54d21]MDY7225496.1 peptide MFS transporter [Hyalangium sp. s54d21]